MYFQKVNLQRAKCISVWDDFNLSIRLCINHIIKPSSEKSVSRACQWTCNSSELSRSLSPFCLSYTSEISNWYDEWSLSISYWVIIQIPFIFRTKSDPCVPSVSFIKFIEKVGLEGLYYFQFWHVPIILTYGILKG